MGKARSQFGGGKTMKGRIWMLAAVVLMFAMALFVSGCGGKQQVQVDEVVEPAPEPEPMVEITPGDVEPLETPQIAEVVAPTISEGRTHSPMLPIYFDYDSSSIRGDQRARIEKNAAFLRDNPQVTIRVEGNCDERGTNEYNMGLGERRAMSAKNYLVNLGIAANRINTVSYGEEKPLATESNENAWTQNRRDDFLIVNQ
jgi:peptidoglycan-associated lipoprotein